MYFLRRLRPLEVAGERVRSLRISLNAPVVTAPDLPAGPARAVIVVHRDSRGRMDASVGLRSVVSGEIAYWSFDGELQSEADLSVAADAALTFAESLGFLFDEAPIAAGAAADKAFRTWFAGEADASASAAAVQASAEPPFELELDELVVEEAPEPPPSGAPDAPRVPERSTLSKFRARDMSPTSTAAARKAPLRQPLARMQLVKRRSPEDERKLALRKILSSF
jgi:hypothetical protein